MIDMSDILSKKIDNIECRVNKISDDVSSQRYVGEIIKYLIYFWAAISAAVGIFGWSKFSDIDKIIEQQVQLQLPKDKQEFAKFREMIDAAKVLSENYKSLAKDYENSVEALKLTKTIGADFDIEGKIFILMKESTERDKNYSDEDSKDINNSIFDSKWRKEAISTLMIFKDSIKSKNYPSEFIFNVTQICRRLKQSDLAEQLTKAAFDKDPSPPVKALYYSSLVQNSVGKERNDAFQNLMNMVVDLPDNSPEIVLAEAWNAAEDQRNYGDLINAIEKLEEKNIAIPSYVFVIKAQALVRQSKPGSIKNAEQALSIALNIMQSETALSSWFSSSTNEYISIANIIKKTKKSNELMKKISD